MLDNMINTGCDTFTYECKGYKRIICDMDNLYDGFISASRNSHWKDSVQKFQINLLSELTKLYKELYTDTWKPLPPNKFILSERGKTRIIYAEDIRDRVVKHVLCDKILIPNISKYLIHDNGASQIGKGLSFTRGRLVRHLRNYYHNYGNNGYVLLMDFSKYYDNIEHDRLLNIFNRYIEDDYIMYLLTTIFKSHELDLSFMSDEEYCQALNGIFNQLDYQKSVYDGILPNKDRILIKKTQEIP